MSLKAIQTPYNGYRFRSRTEARWAVFLDALGVRYEYEPEGFHFGSGGQYLPDFWLPDEECWVEIKGTAPTPKERRLCATLHVKSGHEVFLFIGDFGVPTFDHVSGRFVGAHAYSWSGCRDRHFSLRTEEAQQRWESFGATWKQCPLCYRRGKEFFWLSEESGRRHGKTCSGTVRDADGDCGWMPHEGPGLQRAYAAARAARFEHGESGPRGLSYGRGRTLTTIERGAG